MEERISELLSQLNEDEPTSIEDLAQDLGVSTRTIRSRVAALNSYLSDSGAVEHVRNAGYIVKVKDRSKYADLTSNSERSSIPSTLDGRVRYLINDLLMRNDWVTLDDLSGLLYVSRNTISQCLKQAEQIIEHFELQLERKPRHGVRVVGQEIKKRLCLANLVCDDERQSPFLLDHGSVQLVHQCISEVLKEQSYLISSVSLKNLIIHISVSMERIKNGCLIPMPEEQFCIIVKTIEFSVASEIAKKIQSVCDVTLPPEEIAYIAIHLSGRQKADDRQSKASSLVISEDAWDVVTRMLDRVWDVYRFDFRSDIELRMNLSRHIAPLTVRMKYQMRTENPFRDDVKQRYPLAYSMASDSATVLTEMFDGELSDDEIAYIAMAFALALDHKQSGEKKNILIACASGVGSARFIEHQFRDKFAPYLNRIETCDISSLSIADLSNIDYVFSTVPIDYSISVPVFVINSFLNDDDSHRVRLALREEGYTETVITRCFDEKFFIPHLEETTKRGVISELCQRARMYESLSEDFEQLIWEREQAAPTAFGNQTALPHPIKAVSTSTFVVVGLLDNPIDWDGREVSAVFLVSVSKNGEAQLQSFYRAMSRLLLSREAIEELLLKRRYSVLIDLLNGERKKEGK